MALGRTSLFGIYGSSACRIIFYISADGVRKHTQGRPEHMIVGVTAVSGTECKVPAAMMSGLIFPR